MIKKAFIVLILVLISTSFFLNKKEEKTASFYYWENDYSLNNPKEKLYIKILDIAYSNKIEVIKTTFSKTAPKGFIPVVYITNDTMKNVDYEKISKIILTNLKAFDINELQIDCDWSLSTKSNYFKLLEDLKAKLNKTISATIRLHQIKYYKKTGVPNIDYGVLMYYNMSNIGDINSKNSILDNEIAKKYHYNFDEYPLKLKLALPLYSQAIQFRDSNALDIFEGVKEEDFKDEFEKISSNMYRVKKSTYFRGRYIYKDDLLRFEDSKLDELKIALEDFENLSENRFNEIIFYTYKYKNKYNLESLLKD